MNRTSSGLLTSTEPKKYRQYKHLPTLSISKAILGFIQFKSAQGLSPRTLTGYEHDLTLWLELQG